MWCLQDVMVVMVFSSLLLLLALRVLVVVVQTVATAGHHVRSGGSLGEFHHAAVLSVVVAFNRVGCKS